MEQKLCREFKHIGFDKGIHFVKNNFAQRIYNIYTKLSKDLKYTLKLP